jgi:hypothetical protein
MSGMGRREFMALLGGAASWRLVARAADRSDAANAERSFLFPCGPIQGGTP